MDGTKRNQRIECPNCGNSTLGPNYCRKCGKPLGKENKNNMPNQESTLKIGVWGPAASGKTTYIITVWGACLAPNSRWVAILEDKPTSDFMITGLTTLRRGNFPNPTPAGLHTHYSYLFSPKLNINEGKKNTALKTPFEAFRDWITANDISVSPDTTNMTLKMEFTDVAGEDYFNQPLDAPLWDDILACDGLVCLLDPDNAEEHLQLTLMLGQNLWLKSKGSKKMIGTALPHHIALCYTKVDKANYYSFRDQPEELNQQIANETGTDSSALFSNYFRPERIQLFAISSIGTDENGASLVRDGIITTPKKIRPINVISPLRWLIESLQKSTSL